MLELYTPRGVNTTPKNSDFEFLSDTSAKDKPWDGHRLNGDKMVLQLDAAGLDRPAERLTECAQSLFFALAADRETGEQKLKLQNAHFCHYRHCPVCGWRKSLKNKARFLEQVSALEAQYPKARWLMLTLTVQNCQIGELRETISSMNKAWGRLIKRPEFKFVIGWVRSVEVTRGKDGTAHPHYHCLLMVKPSYFSHGYVKTERWAQVWQECLKVDYLPVCDSRAIKPKIGTGAGGGALYAAAAEVLKYATKAADLIEAGPDWLGTFVEQVHALKFLTSGGALKGIFKATEAEDVDLVHVDEDKDAESDPDDDAPMLRFDWRKVAVRYARKIQKL